MQSHAGVFGFAKESGLWACKYTNIRTSKNEPIINKYTIIPVAYVTKHTHVTKHTYVSTYLFQSFPSLLNQDADTG